MLSHSPHGSAEELQGRGKMAKLWLHVPASPNPELCNWEATLLGKHLTYQPGEESCRLVLAGDLPLVWSEDMTFGDHLVHTAHVVLPAGLFHHLHARRDGQRCPVWDADRHWGVGDEHRGAVVGALIHEVFLAGLADCGCEGSRG